MPTWLLSAVRTAIQAGWAIVATWLIAHQVDVPTDVPAEVVVLVLTLAAGAWTAGVRWLETRPLTSPWGRFARGLARLLMLGIRMQPTRYAENQSPLERANPIRR